MDARLEKAIALRRAAPFQQFGQSNDDLTNNGATGCTDTCLQFISRLWNKGIWTHNQIRRKVGHYTKTTGLTSGEVAAFCRSVGLPYSVRIGSGAITANEMLAYSRRGPVLVGEMYSHHPEWKGFRYGGKVADGLPNGFARPLEKAGKTQLSGFYGRHAIVLLGYTDRDHVYVMEPNHGSPSRPEKPPFDVMTFDQFRMLVNSFKSSTGSTYCFIPTKYMPI